MVNKDWRQKIVQISTGDSTPCIIRMSKDMEAILARIFSPMNFSTISGFPNRVPHLSEWGYLLSMFREEKDDDHVQHLIDFHQCMEQLNLCKEDVLMKMFMFSLKDDPRD
jgi:hypothetical protein